MTNGARRRLNTKGCICMWYYLVMQCKRCDKQLKSYQQKYCSNLCQQEQQYVLYIKRWKQGRESGLRGQKTKLLSKHLRRYLLEKHDSRCVLCKWSKKHPVTNVVPLEVDHIDGNAENNTESNLQLLCPNCHALTPNFRNLNKGKGRSWRR